MKWCAWVFIHKDEDWRVCTYYRGITSQPPKKFTLQKFKFLRVLEERLPLIVKLQVQEKQCGF